MSDGARMDWAACDWGTSNLRLWRMDAADRVIGTATSDRGMGSLSPADYEPELIALLGRDLPDRLPVVICGMAGSRQGWAEARYATVPCAPAHVAGAARVDTADPRLAVTILPGLRQLQPADVMRGEETQIAGFLARHPGWDGVICLPGTHSKWAHVSAGEVVAFRTMMTGELFALLSGHSVLRHSVQGADWDADAFSEAVDRALTTPAALSADLFGIRAGGLVHGLDPGVARARLSGLLIGAELAVAKPYWLGQKVVILGESTLARAYVTALTAQGVMTETAAAGEMTLAGLIAAKHALEAET